MRIKGLLGQLLLLVLLAGTGNAAYSQSCNTSSCCANVGFNIAMSSITYTNNTAVVSFSATFPTTACSDNGNNLLGITSATLNFGDGSPVSGTYYPNTLITHTYALSSPCSNTVITISACVEDEGRNFYCTRTQTISFGNPASAYTLSAYNTGCKTFSFTYAGPAPVGNAQWSYGDNTQSSVITNTAINYTSHTYSTGGVYYVTLNGEGISPCPATVQITVPDFVVPDFNYSVTSSCSVTPITVSLSITNYTSANSYSWLFNGNAVASAGQSATYNTYFQAGPNVVTSIVTNTNGCSTAITKTVVVGSTFGYNINLVSLACKTATFSYTSVWPLNNAQWSFGDGAVSPVITNTANNSIVHTYPAAGSYVVSLSGLGIDPCQVYTTITVTDFMTPDFNYTVVNVCTPTAGIVLDIPNYNNGYTYNWTINNFLVPGAGPTNTYVTNLQQGMNVIKLTVSNGSCNTSVIKYVQIGPPQANFNVTSANVCIGDPLSVYNVASGGDTYTWDILKPNLSWEPPITGMNPAYTFTAAGSYQIKLTIQTNIGPCTSTAALTVSVSTPPDPNFSLTPLSCNNSVSLTIPTSTFTSYVLNYGDGTLFTGGSSIPGAQKSHTYTTAGSFNVQLTLVNGGCTAQFSQNVVISITTPSVIVNCPTPYLCPEGNVGMSAQVVNLPIGAGTLTYSWTGPASFTSSAQSIVVTTAGNYSLQVTSNGACPVNLSKTQSVTALAQPGATVANIAHITCLTTAGSVTLQIPVALQQQGFYVNGTLTAANPGAGSPLSFTVGNLVQGANYIMISNALLQSCNVSIPVNINQQEPTLTVNATQPLNCSPGLGSANLSASPSGGTASWYTLANYPNTAFTTGNSASNLAPGSYVVKYVYGNCVTTANFSIVQPVINITKSGGMGTCGGATSPVTLQAQFSPSMAATFNYNLQKFAGVSSTLISNGSTNTFSLGTGNYSVTVTANGCSATYSFEVKELDPITVTLKTNEQTCNNLGNVTALVSGGDGNYTYKWYWNGNLNGTSGPVLSLTTLTAAASISVNVNDQSGCAASSSPAVVVNPVSQVSLTSCVAPGLQGAQNATKVTPCEISACVVGGVGPYTFDWFREEVVESFHEWKFRYFGSVFKAYSGTDTVIVPVPTGTALNLALNNDYDINTVCYTSWNFLTSPSYTPQLNPAGVLALGSPIMTSTDVAHYYKVLETTTTTVNVLVTSYSGNSGQASSNKDFKNGVYKLQVTDANGCKYMFSIGTLTFAETSTVAVGFDFVWGMNKKPAVEAPVDENLQDLMAEAANELLNEAAKCMQSKIKAVNDYVKNSCSDPTTFKDHLDLSYEVKDHHHTLYYYDRAGRLTKTVPPEGVRYLVKSDIDQIKANRSGSVTPSTWPTLSHTMVTTYTYNSFNQLQGQNTPDGGYAGFIYDSKNRLRFSQNAKQRATNPMTFSYTKYDELGRIIEVGESQFQTGGPVFTGLTAAISASNTSLADNGQYPQTLNSQIARTYYSVASGITYYGKQQRYVNNRVSYTVLDDNPAVSGDEYYTYYSYDSHGNVEWLVQDQPGGMGKNYTAYEYDLVSGKVLKVTYNEKRNDRFYHRYQYDAENRIVKTETSRNGELWDQDASYAYYAHGPLKRQLIGEDHVQGLDYIYTLQGWIKSVNSPSLLTASDPGSDNDPGTLPVSGKAQERTAADRFGMVLNYFNNDYTTVAASNFLMNTTSYSLASYNGTAGPAPSLYNGNISSWISSQLNTIGTAPDLPRVDLFKYDILNRIKQSASLKEAAGGTGWANINNGRDFRTNYGYDANGNILYLSRYQESGQLMDTLRYDYGSGPGQVPLGSNRLNSVTDGTNNAQAGRGDLEATHSYLYDAIGNLVQETGQERVTLGANPMALYNFTTTISWNVYGKIRQVNKTFLAGATQYRERISFGYDAGGNRVKKDYWKDDQASPDGVEDPKEIKTTFYVRDAQGNVMATYERYYDTPNTVFKYDLVEQPIYGSDRLGQNVARVTLASAATFSALVLPGNGSATLSEYQNWITTTSKSQLLPNGNTNDNLCQCRLVSLNSSNNGPYQNLNADVSFLGIASNGIAVAENLSKQLQFYVVLAKKYLGGADACLVFDKDGKLMKGTDAIGSVDINSKPVIVSIPGTTKYAIITLNAAKQPKYHIVDMSLTGYGPINPEGEVIAVNQNLTGAYAGATTHGYHFTGVEDHITGHSLVYSSRYTPDPNDPTKGTTDIMAYDFGTSTLTPTPSTLYSVYGCGNTEAGELQISPDGNKLAWFQYDKFLAGFSYRRGDIYSMTLNSLRTGLLNPPTVKPISEAGNYGNGMLEYMKNANDILYSQRGVYKEGSGSTKYDRNVWKYDPVNLPTISAINPNVSPLISYLFGEIKRGVDGNYYIPNMGRAVDQVHAYTAGTFSSNVSIPDTGYKLQSGLPTQVYKVFSDPGQVLTVFARRIGQKDYELKDHLGNVRVVISDAKRIVDNDASTTVNPADLFEPEVTNYTDYYPFGMAMPSKKYQANGDYRYGFNGKENDNEVRGIGNCLDFGDRTYDPRLAKWSSVDPERKKYPYESPYSFAFNSPIWAIDRGGRDVIILAYVKGQEGTFAMAAITRGAEVMGSKDFDPKKDHVYVIQVTAMSDLFAEVGKVVKDANEKGYGKTVEFSLWSHNGQSKGPVGSRSSVPGFNVGDEDMDGIEDQQMNSAGWSAIDFNFDPDRSIANFYGCYSSGFAEQFSKYQKSKYAGGLGGSAADTEDPAVYDGDLTDLFYMAGEKLYYTSTDENDNSYDMNIYSKGKEVKSVGGIKTNASIDKSGNLTGQGAGGKKTVEKDKIELIE